MDTDALLNVALAAVCLVAVGMSATTIESSVETTPDDVIDISASSVPLGSGEMQRYKDRLQSDGNGQSSGDGKVAQVSAPTKGGSSGERSSASETGKVREAAAPTQGRGTGAYEPSLLDRLLALLRALVELLVSLLPAAALLAVLGAAVVYRDSIWDALGRSRPEAGSGGDGSTVVPAPAPTNEVSEAWYEMATRLDVNRPETKTPRQLADAAVAAGVDRPVVERVTHTFEEVRYGHAEVTEERRQRARRGVQAFRAQYGGDR